MKEFTLRSASISTVAVRSSRIVRSGNCTAFGSGPQEAGADGRPGLAVAAILMRIIGLKRSAAARHATPVTNAISRSIAALECPAHSSHTSVATWIGFLSLRSKGGFEISRRGSCTQTQVGPSAARTTPQRSLSACTRCRPIPPPLSMS